MEDLNVQTIAIPVEEYKELLQKQSSVSMTAAKHCRRATSSRPIRTSSRSRWALTPRASGSSGRAQKLLPKLHNPVTRRAIPMISLKLTMAMTCRSKEV